MTFRKIISCVLCAAALSAACVFSAAAAEGKINFSDPEVTAGAEVNVTMKITADPGTRLSNATVGISYPAEQLSFVDGTNASGGAGTVMVRGAGNGAGTNVLSYNLRFQTSSAGTFQLTVNQNEVYDEDGASVTMSHVGSSTITVAASDSSNANASLSKLEVTPGILKPAFSKDVFEYRVSVGASVDTVSVNAIQEDPDARVEISGNEGLTVGDNTVLVTVTSSNGESVNEYKLIVNRADADAATSDGADYAEGVQLYSRSKTITIMNPSPDVSAPEGFKETPIRIDGRTVKGWIWGASETNDNVLVYGMNEEGELNFYRYDDKEKTIQRYFADPLSADSVSRTEYTELQSALEEYKSGYELRFLIICVLAVIAVILLIFVIYLSLRAASASRKQPAAEKQTVSEEQEPVRVRKVREVREEEVLSSSDASAKLEETQVIRKSAPTKNTDDLDETTVIRREVPERNRKIQKTNLLSREEEQKLMTDIREREKEVRRDDDNGAFDTFDL